MSFPADENTGTAPTASAEPTAPTASAELTAPTASTVPTASTAPTATGAAAIAAYFDERAAAWDSRDTSSDEALARTAELAFRLPAEGGRADVRVLDIGCGTGCMVPAYLAQGASEVVGLDLSVQMIAVAREKFAAEPRVSFNACDILDYAPSASEALFDIIVIYNAYPHIMDKPAVAARVAALLAPGGRFVVAHGSSRAHINARHAHVPTAITSHLEPAAEEAEIWRPYFHIDTLIDDDSYFCFSGTR